MHDALFQGLAIAAMLAGNALLVALGFLAARLLYPASKPEALQEEPRGLQQDLKGIALSLTALSERLVKLEVQIGQLRGPGGGPSLPLNRDADQKFFKVATKLALQGASVEEIMELCGLSRGEADLICMLHANNQVSPSSIAAESVQQLTARMAELRDSDNLSDQGNTDNVSSLRRVG
ncbi:MAG: DUF2802 domain-containing protein [Candidatus Competibacter sp.]|nr:DUF2802 domain-containing protein [Candidatus Competibacter sp.]